MPAFYQPQQPSQFGYPVSDYDGHGVQAQFSAYPDPAHRYSAHYGPDANDFSHTHQNSYDSYKTSSFYVGAGYVQRNGYGGPTNTRQHAAAPMVAPLRVNDYAVQSNNYKRMQRSEHTSYHHQQPNEDDRPVGGVSAKLDYNMDEMTDFVVEMAIAIISPGSYNVETYRKWVIQVLNATRLPSATILLSLSYMTMRVRSLAATRSFTPSEYSLYELVTVALILGSKFLDDNTFQNKSWAEVSNIKVGVLNKEEMNWLSSFGHRLHHDPHSQDGFITWERRWNSYKVKTTSNAIAPAIKTHDNGLHCQRSFRSPISAPAYHPQYPVSAMSNITLDTESVQGQFATANYSPYDAWFSHCGSVDRSPSTAPHTGPNTPEFYTSHGGWHPYENPQTRNRSYGYGSNVHMIPNFESYPPAYEQTAINYGPQNVWNCHGAACQCSSCRQTHVPRYGPIVVG